MSTTRTRFGVSILVALALAAVVNGATVVAADARSSAATDLQLVPAEAHEGFGLIGSVAAAASSRAQVAIALGAGVPMLVIGFMVRRRIYAEAS